MGTNTHPRTSTISRACEKARRESKVKEALLGGTLGRTPEKDVLLDLAPLKPLRSLDNYLFLTYSVFMTQKPTLSETQALT